MKISYSILPSSRTSITFAIHGPQLVRFENKLEPVEEVVSILQCSVMSTDEVFRWLERRMQIGSFSKAVN